METTLKDTSKKNWTEAVAHRPDVFVDGLNVFKDYLVLSERSNGLQKINVLKKGQKTGTYISFPDPAYTVEVDVNAEYDTSKIRYYFISMNRPYSVYDFDIIKNESKLLKEKEVPTYKSSDYTSERVFATATDGTKIPVSLVYKDGTKKDGTAPLFVYGYGSYGISTDPYFSPVRVSLLDRGFVFAIIHIRGGQEMGRAWYDDGKFFKKKNSFTDFIAGTEYLVKEKYGNPKKVYANGGSAGGLLMGAVMNMRPDLYDGIIADVPFVDVVTTMLDSSLPLTTGEYEEWGNPNKKDYYEYMKSYSPYDNVKAEAYPNLLVTTGLNDSQVPFWEPTKWVQKIREMRTDKSKLLLMKVELEVGHGGKSGRFEYLHEEALAYAFVLKLAGKK
jgi:oligopeptidase B